MTCAMNDSISKGPYPHTDAVSKLQLQLERPTRPYIAWDAKDRVPRSFDASAGVSELLDRARAIRPRI
eukprot:6002725-Amphidinium_carterae.1